MHEEIMLCLGLNNYMLLMSEKVRPLSIRENAWGNVYLRLES